MLYPRPLYLICLLFVIGCKPEPLPPTDTDASPVFGVEGRLDGQQLSLKAGLDVRVQCLGAVVPRALGRLLQPKMQNVLGYHVLSSLRARQPSRRHPWLDLSIHR